MPRLPRLVVPHFPHHVTQRGNRKQTTFFRASDYRRYIDLIVDAKDEANVEVLAYCLMPNHVHFVLVPKREDGLAKLFSLAHCRYTREINARNGWRGHLWQERFFSCVMDERHLLAAVRYVELNPVRARLCDSPAEWQWSSVHVHLAGENDLLVNVEPMLELVGSWSDYLEVADKASSLDRLRLHTRTGRPVGSKQFVKALEKRTGRSLAKKNGGRPAHKNK